MDVLKIVTLVGCLTFICLVLALQQRGRKHDVFHLMAMVLWMLFMFVGNIFVPDIPSLSFDPRLRVGAMIGWLGCSYLLAAGCVRLLRRAARV